MEHNVCCDDMSAIPSYPKVKSQHGKHAVMPKMALGKSENSILGNGDDYRTIKINIKLPKILETNLKYNSRDVMLFHMILDIDTSENTLLVNKNKVFWKNGMPPNVAILEPTKERELLTHKIINGGVKNV